MRTSRILALAAILSAGVCTSAFAAFDRIGSVDIARGGGQDIDYTTPGGPLAALQLRADDSDIQCSSIRATFGNGQTHEIYSGTLRQGRMIDMALPAGGRDVKSLAFDCRAESSFQSGEIRIFASV